MTKTIEEQVLIVNQRNEVVGSSPRSTMRSKNLPHRATYVFVFRSDGCLCVQERKHDKDVYPGYFDPACGGVLAENEAYDECATRELEEELGVSGVPLVPHFEFFFEDEYCRVWGKVYSCQYDGLVVMQDSEIESVVFQQPAQILSGKTKFDYSPDSLIALRRLLKSES